MSKRFVQKTKFKLLFQSTLCIFLSLLLINPASAANPSEAVLDFNELNGVFYYNAFGSNRGGGCFGSAGANMNYAGVTVFSDGEMQAIEENRPFYEAAAEAAEAEGFYITWQIIAVVHSMEASLRRYNPDNGQGAYQLYSYIQSNPPFLPAGAISDEEFQRQTNIAVLEVMRAKAEGLDLSNDEDIKQFFLNYNGSGGGHYKEKAEALFGVGTPTYEGSPYVMNRFDALRDPQSGNMSDSWKGAYVSDGVYDPEATWKSTFGAYVKYQALGGGSGGAACGELMSGGMTADEAYSFVETYVNDPSECEDWSTICHIFKDGVGERGANCVTYVQYFLNKYTSLGIISPMGNGGDVVSNLINNHGLTDGGNIPRAYAVFSTKSPKYASAVCDDNTGELCGHTGIVLGINEEADEIYLGQMAYGAKRDWGLTHVVRKLSDYSNGDFTYAYTDEFLKGNI